MNEEIITEHWQVVAAGGRVISTTPEQLWDAAISYFQWCQGHPIRAKRVLTTGKEAGKNVTLEYVRPYTIKAFCLHANISESYIADIRSSHAKTSEWYIIMEKILYVIYNQNLEGAVVDLYNPIIVSKLLSLDKEPGDGNKTVKIEMIEAESNRLASSEKEILDQLDFDKVETLKEKIS